MYVVGNFQISELCLQTFPCKHSFLNKGSWEIMNAVEIYSILKERCLSHPHFEYCKDVIRKWNNPTPEEIRQNEKIIETRRIAKIISENELNEINELNKIGKQFGASARLDKLKLKN